MVEEIMKIWEEKKDEIIKRVSEFENFWPMASDDDLFVELAFCLLTPQSKATVCWKAIENLRDTGVLWFGTSKDIVNYLGGVRFKYTKAENIVKARNFFTLDDKLKIKHMLSKFNNPFEMRDFLVRNIRGIGYKEASHFLRNVGLGRDLAILDRHILKNLRSLGVIEDIPGGLTRKRYMEIEEKMREFAKDLGIRMDFLDLILWYKETGKIFK